MAETDSSDASLFSHIILILFVEKYNQTDVAGDWIFDLKFKNSNLKFTYEQQPNFNFVNVLHFQQIRQEKVKN